MNDKETAMAIDRAFQSENESDRNLEVANVVDGLFAISRAIKYQGDAMHNLVDLLRDRLP